MMNPDAMPLEVLVDMVAYAADAADCSAFQADAIVADFLARLLEELRGGQLIVVPPEGVSNG